MEVSLVGWMLYKYNNIKHYRTKSNLEWTEITYVLYFSQNYAIEKAGKFTNNSVFITENQLNSFRNIAC